MSDEPCSALRLVVGVGGIRPKLNAHAAVVVFEADRRVMWGRLSTLREGRANGSQPQRRRQQQRQDRPRCACVSDSPSHRFASLSVCARRHPPVAAYSRQYCSLLHSSCCTVSYLYAVCQAIGSRREKAATRPERRAASFCVGLSDRQWRRMRQSGFPLSAANCRRLKTIQFVDPSRRPTPMPCRCRGHRLPRNSTYRR